MFKNNNWPLCSHLVDSVSKPPQVCMQPLQGHRVPEWGEVVPSTSHPLWRLSVPVATQHLTACSHPHLLLAISLTYTLEGGLSFATPAGRSRPCWGGQAEGWLWGALVSRMRGQPDWGHKVTMHSAPPVAQAGKCRKPHLSCNVPPGPLRKLNIVLFEGELLTTIVLFITEPGLNAVFRTEVINE